LRAEEKTRSPCHPITASNTQASCATSLFAFDGISYDLHCNAPHCTQLIEIV